MQLPLKRFAASFNISDIGVVPYLNSDYMNISHSTKTFEYAASGLPVVVTKLSALYETFGENGLAYVENLNPESLSEEIINLCLNPVRRMEVSKNAFKKLEGISETVMGERYVTLIENNIKG